MADKARDEGCISGVIPMMGWEADYVGKPYSERGTPPGFHCWSLIRDVLSRHAGIAVDDYGDVSAADLLSVARKMGNGAGMPPFSTQIAQDQAQVFDVVVMKGRPRLMSGAIGRTVNVHVGIMIDRWRVLHTEEGVDVHHVPLTHSSIRFRVAGIYRHEELLCGRRTSPTF